LFTTLATMWAVPPTATIGTGTNTQRIPLSDYWVYTRSQAIYLSSEIGIDGTINILRWYRSDTGADPSAIGTTEIWLKVVADAAFADATWQDPGTLVASISDIDEGAGNGWFSIDITNFDYNTSMGNLMVTTRTQEAPYTGSHSSWRYTATATYQTISGTSDSVNPPVVSLSYNRPNFQIEFTSPEPAVPTLVSPTNGAVNVDLDADLFWTTGIQTDGCDLYFGTDQTLVTNKDASCLLGSNLTAITYDQGTMDYGITYYWLVEAKNSYGLFADSPVWSFTTAPEPYTLPLICDVSSITGWSEQSISCGSLWGLSASTYAGGTSPEFGCNYQNVSPATTRLVTPPLNTTGMSSLDLIFRQYFDAYGLGCDVGIQTSTDMVTWTNEAWWNVNYNTNSPDGGEEISTTITTNLGGVTYVAFVITGNLYQYDGWCIDDITIQEPPTIGILNVTPNTFDYGDGQINWTESSRVFTIRNAGGADLHVNAVALSGTDDDQFMLDDSNSYPLTLTPGASTTVTVTFAPTTVGAKEAELVVTDDTRSVIEVDLNGNAINNSFTGLPYNNSFEAAVVPALPEGIVQTLVATASNPPVWSTCISSSYPTGLVIPDGVVMARFNSYTCQDGAMNRLELPVGDLTGVTTATLQFQMSQDTAYPTDPDCIQVQVKLFGGDWINVGEPIVRNAEALGWKAVSMDLTAYVNQMVQIGFLGISYYGNDIYLDQIKFNRNLLGSNSVMMSEVCDHFPGNANSTGYIELFNATRVSLDFGGLKVRRGVDLNGDGTGFTADSPEVAYQIPAGTIVPGHGMLTIGNGANEADFRLAWGISGALQYLPGDGALDITCGQAYDVHTASIRADIQFDATPNVMVGDLFEQVTPGVWASAPATSGTPGESSSSQTLPVELTAFTATLTTELYVKLAWTSQSETSMIGYNLLRASDNSFGSAIPVNGEPILALNNSEAHNYEMVDQDVYNNTTYYYWIEGIDMDGSSNYAGPVSVTVATPTPPTPPVFAFNKLSSNYPNPFNPTTTIAYTLKGTSGVAVNASMVIYNARGQKVRTLFSGMQQPGDHTITWNGDDENGRRVSSGVYFYKLNAENYTTMKKALLLK